MHVVLLIVILALWGYHMRSRKPQIIADHDLAMWQNYAYDLETYIVALEDQLREYAPIAIDYKVAKGQIKSVRLGTVVQRNGKGQTRTRKAYQLGLMGMPDLPDDYDAMQDESGIVMFAKHAEPVKAEDKKADQSSNGHKGKDNKDQGSFQPVDDLFGNDSPFWSLVKAITDDRKLKNGKLPADQFDWLKAKYAEWQRKPADHAEYQKRFDGRFPK